MNPGSWMIDFEPAVKNAVWAVFGQAVQVLCCFFHFMQCLWRDMQQQGLQARYGQDVEFRIYCNMFGALAFVKPEDLRPSFDLLVNR